MRPPRIKHSFSVISANIAINDTALKTTFFGLHFSRRKYLYIFNHLCVMRPKSLQIRWNNAKYGLLRRSRSFKVTQFGTNRKLICDFYYSNSPSILHRFGDIAFHRFKIAIFGYPFCVYPLPPTEGFPWDDLRKILPGCQRMAKVSNGENFNWLSRAHERYRRQTDELQTDGRQHSRSLKTTA